MNLKFLFKCLYDIFTWAGCKSLKRGNLSWSIFWCDTSPMSGIKKVLLPQFWHQYNNEDINNSFLLAPSHYQNQLSLKDLCWIATVGCLSPNLTPDAWQLSMSKLWNSTKKPELTQHCIKEFIWILGRGRGQVCLVRHVKLYSAIISR